MTLYCGVHSPPLHHIHVVDGAAPPTPPPQKKKDDKEDADPQKGRCPPKWSAAEGGVLRRCVLMTLY